MFVAEPVIKMAINPLSRDGADKLGKALQRFRREDPTFRVATDEETGETVIAGMGELHLDIYVERIRREYGVDVEVGAPKVSYREAPTKTAEYNYKHKKQTGGSGQYAHIVGQLECLPEEAEDDVRVRGESRGRTHSQGIHPQRREGFSRLAGQGTRGRLSDRGGQGDSGRRLVPRSGQLGHGLPDLRPELLPRDVPEDQAGAARSR